MPSDHRVAGSLPPLCDCYQPGLSPSRPEREQQEFADALANAGCNVILCETHCHVGESLSAVRAGVATGKPTWLSLTAGPKDDLMTIDEMLSVAKRAVDEGAQAILINCVPAPKTLKYVQAFSDANTGVPIGAYANAIPSGECSGWVSTNDTAAREYVAAAKEWVHAGATIVGGCCGVGPQAIKGLCEEFKSYRGVIQSSRKM